MCPAGRPTRPSWGGGVQKESLWHPTTTSLFCSRNDIAVLKLSRTAELNDKVGLGCIPRAGSIMPTGYPCYITGWGRISSMWGALHAGGGGTSRAWREGLTLLSSSAGGPLPAKLQQALLPVVGYAECRQPDWWGSSVQPSMVCAGGDIQSGCNVSGELGGGTRWARPLAINTHKNAGQSSKAGYASKYG